jgi:hypothetical protein
MADAAVSGRDPGTPPDDSWELAAGIVRPYLFTQGRTHPAPGRDLPVEAMVTATTWGRDRAGGLPPEQRAVIELCAGPLSIAEVASRLSTPLGVVRVLVGDLADDDLVEAEDTRTDLAADVQLLQRLIARVRAIPA